MTNHKSEAAIIDSRESSAPVHDAHVRKFCEPLCEPNSPEVWRAIDSPWAEVKAHYLAAKLGINIQFNFKGLRPF